MRAHFSRLFGERLWPDRGANDGRQGSRRGQKRDFGASPNMFVSGAAARQRIDAGEIRRTALLATLVNHPDCFDEMSEALGTIAFSATELDNLRQQVLNTLADNPGLDSAGLITHLNQSGFAVILSRVLSSETYGHGFFARPEAARQEVLSGWRDALRMFRDEDLAQEIEEAKRISREQPSEEASRRLQVLTRQKLALKADEDLYFGT